MTTDAPIGTLFAMPSLGADMDEGRITEWLVQPGDAVERGQIVVIVETEKSDIEVEVFESAVVVELLVGEGEMVPVGTPIARFATAGSEFAPATAGGEVPPAASVIERGVEQDSDQVTDRPDDAPAVAISHVTSPVIRHLAEELHVDPERVRGSGPGGRVHRDDVEAAARPATRRRITPRARRLLHDRGIEPELLAGEALVTGDDVLALPDELPTPTPRPPEPPTTEPSTAEAPTRAEMMRRHIAELMTRSWTEIPHYHVAKRIDLALTVERLGVANEQRSVADRLVPGALLLCAAGRAAAKVPTCNGWWRDNTFVPADGVNLGVVLSLRTGGILVPTIEHADELTPDEMMVRLSELVQRARQGRLRASDMSEASITVTNLGDRGADSVGAVIHPPQVAIVGFGAVVDELWPVDGQALIRPTVHASLAGDHRAMDGVPGSRFLNQIQNLLNGQLLEEL